MHSPVNSDYNLIDHHLVGARLQHHGNSSSGGSLCNWF